jgi:hypothetical protein
VGVRDGSCCLATAGGIPKHGEHPAGHVNAPADPNEPGTTARLVLEVPAGWTNPCSRGMRDGHALRRWNLTLRPNLAPTAPQVFCGATFNGILRYTFDIVGGGVDAAEMTTITWPNKCVRLGWGIFILILLSSYTVRGAAHALVTWEEQGSACGTGQLGCTGSTGNAIHQTRPLWAAACTQPHHTTSYPHR